MVPFVCVGPAPFVLRLVAHQIHVLAASVSASNLLRRELRLGTATCVDRACSAWVLCVARQQLALDCVTRRAGGYALLVPSLHMFLLCVVITEHCIMLHEQPQCERLFLFD
jgi:hypothetical protein